MIVYEDGKPKRNDYRKFKIKWVKGANDYASMREVLTRRFSHGLDEAASLKEKGVDEDVYKRQPGGHPHAPGLSPCMYGFYLNRRSF